MNLNIRGNHKNWHTPLYIYNLSKADFMIRYQMAALAFKFFSLTSISRKIYRLIGNWCGNRRAGQVGRHYHERSRWLISKLEEYGLADGRPLQAVELGTGWLHYYGIAVALATDAKIVLYDVWDNRQFTRLKKAFVDPVQLLSGLDLSSASAKSKALKISEACSLDEIYLAANLNYIVDPGGCLASIESSTYDFVFSMDVLEHVKAESLHSSIEAMYRILKPGGLAIHQIGVDDHLAHYDRKASMKQYLAFSPFEWRLRFSNTVQYINLVSFDKFRELFAKAGFEQCEAIADRRPDQIDMVKVNSHYRSQSQESLEAVRLFLVYRKPVA